MVHVEQQKEISIRADDYFSYRPYKTFLAPGSCRATERNKYKGWRFGSFFVLFDSSIAG
jgi:hypothetical protein